VLALAGAGEIIAVDLDAAKLTLASRVGASQIIHARDEDVAAVTREALSGRGVDVVLEAAGSASAFRVSAEAVRPGGQIIWLGKIDVARDVSFRWGSLMGEKRIRRSSYGGARPRRDFPLLVKAYLEGRLFLDELITARIPLDAINTGFDRLRRGEEIRSVVLFD
jgi:S-(hydroxymethyl)glutathione dehydrogenase/alcohol dehydrogenase